MNELFNTNVASRIVYLETKYLFSAINVSGMYVKDANSVTKQQGEHRWGCLKHALGTPWNIA